MGLCGVARFIRVGIAGCCCVTCLSLPPWNTFSCGFSKAGAKAGVQLSFCFTWKLHPLVPVWPAVGPGWQTDPQGYACYWARERRALFPGIMSSQAWKDQKLFQNDQSIPLFQARLTGLFGHHFAPIVYVLTSSFIALSLPSCWLLGADWLFPGECANL